MHNVFGQLVHSYYESVPGKKREQLRKEHGILVGFDGNPLYCSLQEAELLREMILEEKTARNGLVLGLEIRINGESLEYQPYRKFSGFVAFVQSLGNSVLTSRLDPLSYLSHVPKKVKDEMGWYEPSFIRLLQEEILSHDSALNGGNGEAPGAIVLGKIRSRLEDIEKRDQRQLGYQILDELLKLSENPGRTFNQERRYLRLVEQLKNIIPAVPSDGDGPGQGGIEKKVKEPVKKSRKKSASSSAMSFLLVPVVPWVTFYGLEHFSHALGTDQDLWVGRSPEFQRVRIRKVEEHLREDGLNVQILYPIFSHSSESRFAFPVSGSWLTRVGVRENPLDYRRLKDKISVALSLTQARLEEVPNRVLTLGFHPQETTLAIARLALDSRFRGQEETKSHSRPLGNDGGTQYGVPAVPVKTTISQIARILNEDSSSQPAVGTQNDGERGDFSQILTATETSNKKRNWVREAAVLEWGFGHPLTLLFAKPVMKGMGHVFVRMGAEESLLRDLERMEPMSKLSYFVGSIGLLAMGTWTVSAMVTGAWLNIWPVVLGIAMVSVGIVFAREHPELNANGFNLGVLGRIILGAGGGLMAGAAIAPSIFVVTQAMAPLYLLPALILGVGFHVVLHRGHRELKNRGWLPEWWPEMSLLPEPRLISKAIWLTKVLKSKGTDKEKKREFLFRLRMVMDLEEFPKVVESNFLKSLVQTLVSLCQEDHIFLEAEEFLTAICLHRSRSVSDRVIKNLMQLILGTRHGRNLRITTAQFLILVLLESIDNEYSREGRVVADLHRARTLARRQSRHVRRSGSAARVGASLEPSVSLLKQKMHYIVSSELQRLKMWMRYQEAFSRKSDSLGVYLMHGVLLRAWYRFLER
ncbi:MAG: hypothetical protein HYY63_01600, partial [Elusimicrobia bacterium]|nr:hypothetical protein [Elusimicrobiota bacterium]